MCPRKSSKSNETIEQLIESKGFLCEVHKVISPDGYILSLHRIVNPKNLLPKYPVLLMHGDGNYGAIWIFNDADHLDDHDPRAEQFDNSLGFCLAKRGHDVWLGSMRGNRTSRGHVELSSESSEYWDFTLDDIVLKDMPATIDYIKLTTASESIGYVGFSMGSSVMFGLLSSRLEYNSLIKPCISIGPCWRLYNMKSPYKYIGKILYNNWRKKPYLLPSSNEKTEEKFAARMTSFFSRPLQIMFFALVSLLSGFNFAQWNWKRLGVYCAHTCIIKPPQLVAHTLQYILFDKPFSRFDYSPGKNLKLYGSVVPPMYDIGKITNRFMSFIYSSNDWAVSVTDVEITKKCLNVQLYDEFLIADPNWAHNDSLFGNDCGTVVNSQIFRILQNACADSSSA